MNRLAMMLGAGLMVFGCGSGVKHKKPLKAVDAVDLQCYAGKWEEIASYPAWFAKGCTTKTANYRVLPDGKIRLVNRCLYKGEQSYAE